MKQTTITLKLTLTIESDNERSSHTIAKLMQYHTLNCLLDNPTTEDCTITEFDVKICKDE